VLRARVSFCGSRVRSALDGPLIEVTLSADDRLAGEPLTSAISHRRSLWRRVWAWLPAWAWAVAGTVQVACILPFWLLSSLAQYHALHGDVYRGWPLIYGLDQGDVGGDDFGPFITYLHPARFALDTAAGVGCALPPTVLIFVVGRRSRRRLAGR
jgi:hypothetical protein